MKKIPYNLLEILNILSSNIFTDGDTIGKKLGITRSAVWKAIKKLEEYEIKIESVKGKGYSISEPLWLLNENLIKSNLNNKKIIVDIFESIDSTNSYLKSYSGQNEIRACLAEYQTKGKGRLNRKWFSPFAQNIYLSIYYPFKKDLSELSGLSMVVGLTIAKILEKIGLYKVSLKWPNDILYNNKKLSGILIETQSEANGYSYVTIGIGLNINMVNDQNNIDQEWSSLKQILDKTFNRNDIVIEIINELEKSLILFDTNGFEYFQSEWHKYDYLKDKQVVLNLADKSIKGISKGINENGNLLVEIETGYIKPFSYGDVTLSK